MPTQPVLLDVSCLCDAHSDDALDGIYKALSEDPPDASIWDDHPNPFIRRIVDLFTARGLDRIAGLQDDLQKWLSGDGFVAGLERPARPEGAMVRWSAAELSLTKLYLQALPQAEWTLDDWTLLVDFLVQRYLPASDLRTEAGWLVTRSALMGRAQAAMREPTGVDAVLAALPVTTAAAEKAFGMTPEQRAVIEFGWARACEHVTALSDTARHRMRSLVVDHQEAVYLRTDGAAESLQTKLTDTFGQMNRDWRRIAVTEAGECANQGFIAAQALGTKVRRVEKYRGACAFCRSIDGRIMTIVSPGAGAKDGETSVWVGKSNVGRSASPKRRGADGLVDREPKEMFWIAAGTQHPHCRGSWVRVAEGASADPAFDAWLEKMKQGRGK